MLEEPVIKYNGEQVHIKLEQDSFDFANRQRTLALFGLCQSFITMKYYMRLLSDEFSRDLTSLRVRSAIRRLFENPNVAKALELKLHGQAALKELLFYNETLQNFEGRNP